MALATIEPSVSRLPDHPASNKSTPEPIDPANGGGSFAVAMVAARKPPMAKKAPVASAEAKPAPRSRDRARTQSTDRGEKSNDQAKEADDTATDPPAEASKDDRPNQKKPGTVPPGKATATPHSNSAVDADSPVDGVDASEEATNPTPRRADKVPSLPTQSKGLPDTVNSKGNESKKLPDKITKATDDLPPLEQMALTTPAAAALVAPLPDASPSVQSGNEAVQKTSDAKTQVRSPGVDPLPVEASAADVGEEGDPPGFAEVIEAKAKSIHTDDGQDGLAAQAAPLYAARQQHPTEVAALTPQPHAAPAEADFSDRNHPSVVTGIRGQLLPNGGTMHIRLEPPELGDMQITVQVRDGVLTAAFQTSNEQATKLLSHSLGQLKTVLESGGLNVEKLHVSQTPRGGGSQGGGDASQQRDPGADDESTRRERQRRELMQRLWKRLSGSDPLDTTA